MQLLPGPNPGGHRALSFFFLEFPVEAAAYHSAVLRVALLTHASLPSQRQCPHFADGESVLDTVPRIMM